MIRWPGFPRPWCSTPRRVRRALLVCVTLAIVGSVPPAAILADGDDGALLTVVIERSEQALVLDPALAGDEKAWTILANTNNGLMAFRREGGWKGAEVVPDLAARMPRSLDGGRRLVFQLREDARFTRLPPGAERTFDIKASDVAASLRRLLAMDSPGRELYENIKGARAFIQRKGRGPLPGVAFDDSQGTVTLSLEQPDPAFLMALAMPYASVLPRETPAFDQSRKTLPATGPYFIRRYEPNRVIELSRSPRYQPLGKSEGIQVKFVGEDQALQDIAASEADASLTRFAPADLDPFRNRRGVQVERSNDATVFYFFMNTAVAPFDDPRVREAVDRAINRTAIADLYDKQAVPTAQAIPKVVPGGSTRLKPRRSYGIDRARQLIKAADHEGTKVVVWGYLAEPSATVTRYLVTQLRRIGLKADSRIVAESRYAEAVSSPKTKAQIGYAVWRASDGLPDPGSLFSRLGGGDRMNFSFYDDPGTNAAISRASDLPLGPTRDRAWHELDTRLGDDDALPWIPFAHSRREDLISDRVQPDSITVHPVFGLLWSKLTLK